MTEPLWTDERIISYTRGLGLNSGIVTAWMQMVRDEERTQLLARIAELQATKPNDTEINPAAGCTVYNYSAVYLDDGVTPEEAATMILATLGPVYVDKLIDALMDTFNSQPRDTESVKENL